MSGMRATRCVLPALVALTIAASAVLVSPAAAQTWESTAVNPDIQIAYVPPDSAGLHDVYQALVERKVLEELQHFFAPLHLPHPLRLLTKECKDVNAYYSSSDRSLTLCYEMVAYLMAHAPQTVSADGFITHEAAIIGGLVSILMHESGHMMFDMFDVPIFGREEDAADETASFLALQFNKDVARTLVKGFVYQWATEQDPAAAAPISAFSNEHGTASQRMYNALCLAYGGDRQTFQEFVDRGWLPTSRAANCGAEFEQVKFAFETAIFPFIDRDLMAKVTQAQWLTADELK